MKKTFAFLSMIIAGHLYAASGAADDTSVIAKGIQCSFLREKSFLNLYEQYDVEKPKGEYIKKVSDSIYSQAFKICDPENTANADKEILNVCTPSCDQAATKGLMGLGGPSATDIEKCKKMCQNYSDQLGLNYVSATKGIKKYIEMNPKTPCKEQVPPALPAVVPSPAVSESGESKTVKQ